MKTFKHLFILGILLFAFSSCSTTQTFVVHGTPGTVISKCGGERLAVIDPKGQTEITMNRSEGYVPFLMAKEPGSNLEVPFALDYEDHNRTEILNLAKAPCLIAGGVGAVCLFGQLLNNVNGEDINVGVAITGLALYLTGFTGALTSISYSKHPIDIDYDYLKHQNTNNDLIR